MTLDGDERLYSCGQELMSLYFLKNARAMVWMSVSSLWVGMTVVNSEH